MVGWKKLLCCFLLQGKVTLSTNFGFCAARHYTLCEGIMIIKQNTKNCRKKERPKEAWKLYLPSMSNTLLPPLRPLLLLLLIKGLESTFVLLIKLDISIFSNQYCISQQGIYSSIIIICWYCFRIAYHAPGRRYIVIELCSPSQSLHIHERRYCC